MKNLFLIFSLLLITSCGNKDSIHWFIGDLNAASSIAADNKIIMLDFYTDW